jgi:hypothetical protein
VRDARFSLLFPRPIRYAHHENKVLSSQIDQNLFLVYVIIAMFCVASSIALYSCVEPFVMWSYEAFPGCPKLQLPYVNLLICKAHLELRQALLLAVSISVAVVWAVFRNEDWAWILQDILGIMFW